MSDNWTPPPGRNPNEPEPEGDEPTGRPDEGSARRDGQSPLWWTESAEKQKEYLQPAPPGEQTPLVGPPGQRNLTWNLPPYSQPGATPPRPPAGNPGATPPPRRAGNPGPGGQPGADAGQPGPGSAGPRRARHAGAPGPTPPPQQPQPQPAEGGFQGLGQPVQQPPTWQYPPIPIPQPPGPGRRRKPRQVSKGLLIGLVVLAVFIVGSGITLALRNGGDDNVPAASDTPVPSPTPSETPSVTPSPTPTAPAPPTVDEIVTTSKLYKVGVLSPTPCVEPKAIPSTYAGAKAYYGLIVPCMNRTWYLAMKKAGLPYRAPKLVVYAGALKTGCGQQRGNRAYYCHLTETIYMPYALGIAYYKRNPVSGRVWMMNSLAHEYGHHVQKLSGIYAASLSRQLNAATPVAQLTESRTRELQAACFGSAYLGAAGPYIPLRGPLLATWKVLVANTGDEFSRPLVRDRGNRVNHNYWSVRGFNTKSPDVCNSFVAKPVLTN
ncbi:neutral zinc metallopeptidase [Kribbella sp. CA-293567]|uniref:neutral zinc metallopeptidase n=1 Tax=Kribbella sp. CA-293567 TaxID=3002436 RepID=UPI0022DD67B8|nr:neutral zinc metallopeptidase [Kribbella sp. CA-293567]WBQ04549.1 neutral zinc metallopeptidase [Kribbella sp. CA-293567]